MSKTNKQNSSLTTVFSNATGNWFRTGNANRSDLLEIARANPYTKFELCELIHLSNETGLSLHVLGRTIESVCLDQEGKPWVRMEEER